MKNIELTEEETKFIEAMLLHQADYYLHISRSKAVDVLPNQRICNDILFKLEN